MLKTCVVRTTHAGQTPMRAAGQALHPKEIFHGDKSRLQRPLPATALTYAL